MSINSVSDEALMMVQTFAATLFIVGFIFGLSLYIVYKRKNSKKSTILITTTPPTLPTQKLKAYRNISPDDQQSQSYLPTSDLLTHHQYYASESHCTSRYPADTFALLI